MCAKLVLNRKNYDIPFLAMKELHWLPVTSRIKLKILCNVFNCKIGQAPQYLVKLLHKSTSGREGLRSSQDQHQWVDWAYHCLPTTFC